MYFCAWRDLVIAENELKQQKTLKARSKSCMAKTARQLANWSKKRDMICERDAAEAVGGGSDEPHQRGACKTSMTDDYAQHFDELTACK